MKERKVISRNNLPTHFPFLLTAVSWLLMDRLHAPGWAYGVVGTILVLVWIGSIYNLCTEKPTEVL